MPQLDMASSHSWLEDSGQTLRKGQKVKDIMFEEKLNWRKGSKQILEFTFGTSKVLAAEIWPVETNMSQILEVVPVQVIISKNMTKL